jgi:hypothetical protein
MDRVNLFANHFDASNLVQHPIVYLTFSLLLLFVLSKAYISTQTAGISHPPTSSLDDYALAPCQGRIPSDLNWYCHFEHSDF